MKTPEELFQTIQVIEHYGQEIALNEVEMETWNRQSEEQKDTWANEIRKAMRNGLIEWKEKEGIRHLSVTEKGKKGYEKRIEKKKKREQHLLYLNHVTAPRPPKPKFKKISNSPKDQKKIRRRIENFKREKRKIELGSSGDIREIENLDNKINRLKSWLKPRMERI